MRRAMATQLWVQSRLGAIGQLGSPEFETEKQIRCRVREARRSGGRPDPVDCRGDRKNLICGPLPTDAVITPKRLIGLLHRSQVRG